MSAGENGICKCDGTISTAWQAQETWQCVCIPVLEEYRLQAEFLTGSFTDYKCQYLHILCTVLNSACGNAKDLDCNKTFKKIKYNFCCYNHNTQRIRTIANRLLNICK